MKNALFALVFALLPLFSAAQTIDGVNLADRKDIALIQVNIGDAGKFGKQRWICTVDYGQQPGGNQNFTILDDKGERRVWVSHMEVLNYFAALGWKLMFKSDVPGGAAGMQAYIFSR